MAMAISLSVSRGLLRTSAPQPSLHLYCLPREHRLSLTASAAAGASPPSAPDAGTPAWDALAGVSVFAAGTGDVVQLRDLWEPTEGVAVVALLRHFGCFCCWELASELEKFESAGAKLIAIAIGTSDKARILADRGEMFVFRGKELLYTWKDEGTGDHAPLDDVLSICGKVQVS